MYSQDLGDYLMCFDRIITENNCPQKITRTLLILHLRMPMVTLLILILVLVNLLVRLLSSLLFFFALSC